MKRREAILDVLVYLLIPIAIWHTAKDLTGSYAAILLCTVPGLTYGIYRFLSVRRVQFTSLFVLLTLLFGSVLDLAAGSALQLLWNSVLYGFAMSSVYLVSMVMKRPIALYFALDAAALKGCDRNEVKAAFTDSPVFALFQLVTLLFALRNAMVALLNIWLIQEYGVDGYAKGMLLKQLVSWILMGVVGIGYWFIHQQMKAKSRLALSKGMM